MGGQGRGQVRLLFAGRLLSGLQVSVRQQHGGAPAHGSRKRAISPERVDVVRQVGLEVLWPMPALHS